MVSSKILTTASLVAAVSTQVSAFAPTESRAARNVVTNPEYKTTSLASAATDDIFHKFSEESRQFRRTVYTHDEWVRHRSPDRFVRNIKSITQSGIYGSVLKEVLAVTTVSGFLIAWNAVFGTYQDLAGVVHDGPMKDMLPILTLPLTPFTLSSSSLGLFLVFRTNKSYKRWDEARKNWGMNINHTRDLVRMGNAYYDRSAVSPQRAEEDLQRLALCTWAFVRAMKRHLSPTWEDEEAFQKELFEKLPADQAQNIIDAAHRPNRALQDLSSAIENLPMHFIRKNEVHAAATIFEDNLGSSERLLSSPIPVFYARWSARFLAFWLLLLPLGLYGPLGNSWNHIDLIPVTATLSMFLFGIEELATQLEEPFTILPMQGFCDKIYNWITEIASFTPGDNGMPVYQYDNTDVDIGEELAAIYGSSSMVPPPPPSTYTPVAAAPAATVAPPQPAGMQQPLAPTYEAAATEAPATAVPRDQDKSMSPEIDFMVYSAQEKSPETDDGEVSVSVSIRSQIKRVFKRNKD